MQLLRSKKKIRELYAKYFSEEMIQWLTEEIKLNKRKPMLASQREFWAKPEDPKAHDPRGCPSYVAKYIDPYLTKSKEKGAEFTLHKPHPNVVDELYGTLKDVQLPSPAEFEQGQLMDAAVAEAAQLNNDDASDEDEQDPTGKVPVLVIPEEYRIPQRAQPIQYM